jgi:CheY-like chemotaxis protein
MNASQVEIAELRAPVAGKRILLVEDEVGVRETLKLVLRLDGHSIVEVSNGREACLAYAPGDFDLVITDYSMPGMKGDELARTLKCLVPSQRILMLTAYSGEVNGSENPVDSVLEKPFAIADLREKIDALFPSCSARGSLASV